MRSHPLHILCSLAVCLMASPTLGQSAAEERLARVQAAYTLNFVRYATWPPEAFADEQAPVVIAVVGRPTVLPYLRGIMRGEEVQGRPVRVRSIRPPDSDDDMEAFLTSLRQAHVVFLPAESWRLTRVVSYELRGDSVLTISDAGGFASRGGMIELDIDGGRLVFDVNATALKASSARLSSKALSLARRVVEEPAE